VDHRLMLTQSFEYRGESSRHENEAQWVLRTKLGARLTTAGRVTDKSTGCVLAVLSEYLAW
jgi:hypothetical protein